MHTKILEEATHEHLKKFVDHSLKELKHVDHDMYEELEYDLYIIVYGHHFNEWKLNCALEKMSNEDGTTGGHWTLEETDTIARNHGIEFRSINKYDWNYTLNMVYSDFYGSIPNELSSYVKVAKKFLQDKDAPEGKALKYYIAMSD